MSVDYKAFARFGFILPDELLVDDEEGSRPPEDHSVLSPLLRRFNLEAQGFGCSMGGDVEYVVYIPELGATFDGRKGGGGADPFTVQDPKADPSEMIAVAWQS